MTDKEKELLTILQAIDKYLPGNRPTEIKLFKEKYTDQNIANGFFDGHTVYLRREILTDFTLAADVYVHEKTHQNTNGALDASAEFRNYLSFALARLALEQLKKEQPDLIE